jgi:hypothetical protein
MYKAYNMTPEAKARVKIDELLTQAGWSIFNHKQANIYASNGVLSVNFL